MRNITYKIIAVISASIFFAMTAYAVTPPENSDAVYNYGGCRGFFSGMMGGYGFVGFWVTNVLIWIFLIVAIAALVRYLAKKK